MLKTVDIPSFEEGAARRSSRCHATLISARRGRSDIRVSDLPCSAAAKVAQHFVHAAQRPLLEGGDIAQPLIFVILVMLLAAPLLAQSPKVSLANLIEAGNRK